MSSAPEMDPVFFAALRRRLVTTVTEAPRARRRWRWRLGIGVLAGSSLLACGAVFAAGVFSPPGAPLDTELGTVVTATRTGTATIELGAPPSGANAVSLTLTCFSVGTFQFPDGSSLSCDTSDLSHTPPLDREAVEDVPLQPGQHSVTIETAPDASWTLQAVYVDHTITPWATNTSGETYGVPNQQGTPDLVAVVIDHGEQQGYVKASDLDCASGRDEVRSPADALAWDSASKNRNVSVPVYDSDGLTVIGTFVVGDAEGPDARTIPVSELAAACSEPAGTGASGAS